EERCALDTDRSTLACTRASLAIEDLFKGSCDAAAREERELHVAPLGDRVLVVWNSKRGGVRMRLAKADALASAEDVGVFDDLTTNGRLEPASLLVDLRLFARPRFAVVALTTSLGVHLLRIDDEGRVAALGVVGE